jgi:hypothetical protein
MALDKNVIFHNGNERLVM